LGEVGVVVGYISFKDIGLIGMLGSNPLEIE